MERIEQLKQIADLSETALTMLASQRFPETVLTIQTIIDICRGYINSLEPEGTKS